MSLRDRRSNILLIHSDQHRFDCVGVNQAHAPEGPGRLVATPNLDRLASKGTTFSHAFTPIPVCTPARASLITGTWPSQHGAWVLPNTVGYQPADPEYPNLYRLLSSAGYEVAHIGKYHQELKGTPADHGATTFCPEEDYIGFRSSLGLPPRTATNGFWGEVDPVDDDKSRLAWGADLVIGQINKHRTCGRPFFIRWDPSEPHLPNLLTQRWANAINGDDIPPWANFQDDLSGKPTIQRRSRERWGCGGWTWDQWRPVVGRYLGEVMQLDHHVGRVLAAVEDQELLDETLVIYTSDHGDLCGAHGLVDKHFCGYDDVLRVPLIMRWPGHLPTDAECSRFVTSAVDVAATAAKAALGMIPETFRGRDLSDEAKGVTPQRDEVFSQYSGTKQARVDQRYLRTRRWKYVYSPAGEDELYDLINDPGELHNLMHDHRNHDDVINHLKRRMTTWMAETSDPLTGPLWAWPPRTAR